MKKVMPTAPFREMVPLIDVEDVKKLKGFHPDTSKELLKNEADSILDEHYHFFFNEKIALMQPRWHRSHASENPRNFTSTMHWSDATKEIPPSEDIKLVWELSRFHWCTVLARATRVFKDDRYLNKMNHWLDDWRVNNPINQGINWSCGQETSYRVIHLLMTHFILESRNNAGLEEFMSSHLTRISRTLGYGVAQKSNHGFTESVALFIGGAWLTKNSKNYEALGVRCQAQGLSALEKLILNLIQDDGSFAMYSNNYQRVTMQLLSFTLYSIAKLQLKPLGSKLTQRIERLACFHEALVDPMTGSIPNLGANDGAYPLKLNSINFSDHRPSCIVLSALLQKQSSVGNFCEDLAWFDAEPQKTSRKISPPPHYQNFPNAGLAVITPSLNVKGILRYPAFHFRPSQSDIGHFDLWINGINVLSDRGTYSYTSQGPLDFSGTESHNTLWVPGTEAMRKVGRFLYKDWHLKEGGIANHSAFCILNTPYFHKRTASLEPHQGDINDQFKCPAFPIINWNLVHGDWKFVSKNIISNDLFSLEIISDQDFSLNLVEELRSNYYNSLEKVLCLKVHPKGKEGSITTRIRWKNVVAKTPNESETFYSSR